jgi:hypothetical protein
VTRPPCRTRALTRLQPGCRFFEMRVESFSKNEKAIFSHGEV